jgi:PAS fold
MRITLNEKTSWTAIKQIIGVNNNQPDLFLTLINEDGIITCANATMIKDLEIGDLHHATTNFFDLVHPFNLDGFKNTLRETSKGSQANGIELYIKNGIYHPMKWQVGCLTDLSLSIKTYLCVGYKLADDERMNRFNKLLKNNCHSIIESLSGVVFHEINGDLIAINQKVAGIFGTTLENLYRLKNIGALWKNQWIITNEGGQPVPFEETPFVNAAKTRRLQTQTLIIRLKNGEDRWVLFNSQPLLREEVNRQFPVVSNIIDVPSERQLSNRLKEREAIINAFLQETPDLAWVIDEDANLLFASNAFCLHFGVTEMDCSSKKVTDMVPPAVTRAVFEDHIKVFETDKPLQVSEKIK